MRVMLPRLARLPHSVIRLPPMVADVLAILTKHLLRFAVDLRFSAREMCHCLDHLAVNVELKLFGRCVAEANWIGAGVSGEVRQSFLARDTFAIDVVKSSQLRPRETDRKSVV